MFSQGSALGGRARRGWGFASPKISARVLCREAPLGGRSGYRRADRAHPELRRKFAASARISPLV